MLILYRIFNVKAVVILITQPGSGMSDDDTMNQTMEWILASLNSVKLRNGAKYTL